MYKNHTTVLSLFFIFAFQIASSVPVFAAEDRMQVSEACVKSAETRFKCASYVNTANYERCITKAYNACGGGLTLKEEDLTCKESQEKFSEAYSEFNSSCRKARMGSGSSCVSKALKCSECNGADDSDLSDTCDSSDDGASAVAKAIKALGVSNVSTSQNTIKYSYCPSIAAEDLKELREEVKDKKKDVKEIKDEVSDLEKEIAELKDEFEKLKLEKQEKLDELEAKNIEDMEALKEEEEAITGDKENSLSAIEIEIQKAEDSLEDIKIQEYDARIERDKKESELKQTCHKTALDRVIAEQQAKQNLIQVSQYSAGGFNSLMKSVGLDKKSTFNARVKKYYNTCIADFGANENLKAINKAHNSTIKKFNAAKARINRTIAQLKEQKNKVLQDEPKKLGKIALKFKKLEAQFKKAFDRAVKDYDRQLMRLYNLSSGKGLIQLAEKNLGDASSRLRAEDAYLNQKTSYLSTKEAISKAKGMSSSEAGATDTALSDMGDVLSAAQKVISECNCKRCQGEGTPDGKMGGDKDCSNAMKFIYDYYNDPEVCNYGSKKTVKPYENIKSTK